MFLMYALPPDIFMIFPILTITCLTMLLEPFSPASPYVLYNPMIFLSLRNFSTVSLLSPTSCQFLPFRSQCLKRPFKNTIECPLRMKNTFRRIKTRHKNVYLYAHRAICRPLYNYKINTGL